MLIERDHVLEHDIVARCKSFGHTWFDAPARANAVPVPRGCTALHFRCDRCGMEKTYFIDNLTGEGKPRYYPPAGYSDWVSSRADWKVTWAWTFRNRAKAS